MSKLRCSRVLRDRAKGGLVLVCLLPAVIGGGCAQQTSYSQPNWYAGGPAPRQSAAAVPIPVEMEDDGRPAQLPPRVDVRAAPDDPSQPWSPNYGGPSRRVAPAQAQGGPDPSAGAPRHTSRVAYTPGYN
jgi:hypothetical protein